MDFGTVGTVQIAIQEHLDGKARLVMISSGLCECFLCESEASIACGHLQFVGRNIWLEIADIIT